MRALFRPAAGAATIGLVAIFSCATPAFAATSTISTADTAWMIVATALVLMMTIPGLALFYSGMVRKKNVLATMAQSLAAVMIISILWAACGYSLVFAGDGPWLGTLDRLFLAGMGMDSVNPALWRGRHAGLVRGRHLRDPEARQPLRAAAGLAAA